MRQDDLALLRLPTAPTVHPDGHDVVISLDRLDMSANRYRSALWTVDPGDGSRRRLTNGPRDTSPSYSPRAGGWRFSVSTTGSVPSWPCCRARGASPSP
jgi:dipeptidyl aminopeptidase/acylaminoacyl peptidase